MPTGYTAAVRDGKITTLREFALSCARGMGALITMRDDPHDAPIPERFEPFTDFYDGQIERAQELLRTVPHLTDSECDFRAETLFKEEIKSYQESLARKRLARARYEDMLCKVKAWRCDDEVRTLKDFMVKQLEESIDFDCSERYTEPPVRLTGEQWRQKTLENASRDLAYGQKQQAEERERVSRNRWLAALRRSLES